MSAPGRHLSRHDVDVMPISMFLVVMIVSLIILAHLAVVLWLSCDRRYAGRSEARLYG